MKIEMILLDEKLKGRHTDTLFFFLPDGQENITRKLSD